MPVYNAQGTFIVEEPNITAEEVWKRLTKTFNNRSGRFAGRYSLSDFNYEPSPGTTFKAKRVIETLHGDIMEWNEFTKTFAVRLRVLKNNGALSKSAETYRFQVKDKNPVEIKASFSNVSTGLLGFVFHLNPENILKDYVFRSIPVAGKGHIDLNLLP